MKDIRIVSGPRLARRISTAGAVLGIASLAVIWSLGSALDGHARNARAPRLGLAGDTDPAAWIPPPALPDASDSAPPTTAPTFHERYRLAPDAAVADAADAF